MMNLKSMVGKSAAWIVEYADKNAECKKEMGYYAEGSKAPSMWHGRGAEMLGLSGPVDGNTLKALLEKGPPGMATVEGRRMGVDLTWSAPKSVSLLMESAPPEMRERILALCAEANGVAMQHIEDHVITARYGKGGQIVEKTGSAIIATYQHDDARPTVDADGRMKVDPDMHFHNLLINATHDGEKWRSLDLDFGALSVEQHLADAKAKAHLAAGLQKIGISVEKTKDAFEVAGISRDQVMAFSDRSKEIEKALSDKGLTRETSSAAERNVANLDTRQSKLRGMTQEDLRYQWRERLRDAGVDFATLYDKDHDNLIVVPTTTKEMHNEQRERNRQFFKHAEQLYPENAEYESRNGLRSLSECRLDAVAERKSASLLQDTARADRPAHFDMRRVPADVGGLTPETEAKARQAIDAALDHLSEKDSLFDRRQLALEAIKAGMGEVSGADIEAAMATHARIVWAGEQTKVVEKSSKTKAGEPVTKATMIRAEMVTTTDAVGREGWIQGFCAEGRGKITPLMDKDYAEKAAQDAENRQGFAFADDQKAAVIATLTSEDRVTAMIGGAGTGKTTAMKSMVDAARSAGYETVGLTPSHGARQELLDAGTDKNVTTATFLMQKEKEDQKPRMYILDEAGMVGDKTMQAVLQKMGPRDRILLSGDPDQMKPVEAGDPLQTLTDKGIIAVAHLTKVQRQAKAADPDLLALGQAWADKDTTRALDLVRKFIKEAKLEDTGKPDKDGAPTVTKEDRRNAIAGATVDTYMSRSIEDRLRTMIICPTNAVRQMINGGIREKLQESGALPSDQIIVTQLKSAALTATHMRQAHQYEPGQIMRTKEGRGDNAKVVDYEVVKADGQQNRLTIRDADGAERTIDAAKIDPKKWQVFDKKPDMGLAVGEKIVIRDNSTKGAQNGDGGQITSINGGLITLQMDRGQMVTLDANRGLAVDYGYARTVNDSQGKSVDLPIMTGEASAGSSRNLLLVVTTRMRHGLTVITDHADGLIKRSQDYADKNVASEARKHADKATDRRLDLLDALLAKGMEYGAKTAERQMTNMKGEKTADRSIKFPSAMLEDQQEKEHVRHQDRDMCP